MPQIDDLMNKRQFIIFVFVLFIEMFPGQIADEFYSMILQNTLHI